MKKKTVTSETEEITIDNKKQKRKREKTMGRKWNNIKEKKAAKDANTSKIYAKFGREIYQAAKSGEPDPESNRNLKVVLERAKTYRVPKNRPCY